MGTVSILSERSFLWKLYSLVYSVLSKTNKPLLFRFYFLFTNLLQEGIKSESLNKIEAILIQDSTMVRHPVEVLNDKQVDSSKSLVFWQ